MRALLSAIVVAASLAAASSATAIPIVYEFSGIYSLRSWDPVVGPPPPSQLHQLDDFLPPCLPCYPVSGKLRYDSDLGVAELDLVSEIVYQGPDIDLGGRTSSIPSPTTSSDTLSLGVYKPRTYFTVGSPDNVIYGGGAIEIYLDAPGLIADGEIRTGLTISDFRDAWMFNTFAYENWTLGFRHIGDGAPCPDGEDLQCAQSDEYSGGWDVRIGVFKITEIHQVAALEPEGLAVLAVLGLFLARSRGALVS